MKTKRDVAPRRYQGVMVGSTFTDLQRHRELLIDAIDREDFAGVAMEYDAAKVQDVIDSSLTKVRDAAAYALIIGTYYGQIPQCERRNPGNVSITELEFDEALACGRPILLFIMSEAHPVLSKYVETDPVRIEKRRTFIERAKKITSGSKVHRVYADFDSPEDLRIKAAQSFAHLRRVLENEPTSPPHPPETDGIPLAPAFYAEPPYIGSHAFVGRQEQIELLNRWARSTSPHPVMLLEAIGGTGKSILTWEWVKRHAPSVRQDWAGVFWYSFYERGAVMADFCHRALAYITGRPIGDFVKWKAPKLKEQLLDHLSAKPYLFVLDGLERVLVAYHRFDCAAVLDEVANSPTDAISDRHPCAAIRPDDDELLKSLVASMSSKVLVSSRLVPKVLVNSGGLTIPGVSRVALPGLRPEDAEILLRDCGVSGTSQRIRDFLEKNCDCHPLITGVLGGLINDYFPDPGNFDAWEIDPAGGGRLDLGSLNLIKIRNDILKAALEALHRNSRELLSVLALIDVAVDYTTLMALNPFAPPEPEKVEVPRWDQSLFERPRFDEERFLSDEQEAHRFRAKHEQKLAEWRDAVSASVETLKNSVRDLEKRGLLQFDRQTKRHDLHPVVRAVASSRLADCDKERLGTRVVDFFSQQTRHSYIEAESLEDLRAQLHVIHTLLKIGAHQRACDSYLGVICDVLQNNLNGHAEALAILKPFFKDGWLTMPTIVGRGDAIHLMHHAGVSLLDTGHRELALNLNVVGLRHSLLNKDYAKMANALVCIANALPMSRTAAIDRITQYVLEIAQLTNVRRQIFMRRLDRFTLMTRYGRFKEAQEQWDIVDRMGRDWPPESYRAGRAEERHVTYELARGTLTEQELAAAEQLARKGRERDTIESLHELRGRWELSRENWDAAIESFTQAVRMAREDGGEAFEYRALLALGRVKKGDNSFDARAEAEEIERNKLVNADLAKLWLAVGDRQRAEAIAREAYKDAWADGAPNVYWSSLQTTTSVLRELMVPLPDLPAYDSQKEAKLEWEESVIAAIDELRRKRSKKKNGSKARFVR